MNISAFTVCNRIKLFLLNSFKPLLITNVSYHSNSNIILQLKWDVFSTYIKACGAGHMTGVAIFYTIFLACEVGTGVWLRYWSDHAQQRDHLAFWLGGYTGISMLKGTFVNKHMDNNFIVHIFL